MNIINCFGLLSRSFNHIEGHLLQKLSLQQRKVTAIALLAIGCIGVMYFLTCYFWKEKLIKRLENKTTDDFKIQEQSKEGEENALLLPFAKDNKRLDLVDYPGVDDKLLEQIAETCTQLEEINLQGCTDFTDKGLKSLAQKCSLLKKINLEGCKQITNEGLKTFALHCCPQITHLDLRILDDIENISEIIDDEFLKILFQRCHEIESLKVSWCSISEETFSILSQNSRCLRTIVLKGLLEKENGLIKLIQNSPFLEEFEFEDGAGMTNQTLFEIAQNCPALKVIKLGKCKNITDDGVIALAKKCADIRVIDLSMCDGHGPVITDLGLAALGQGCPKLQEINLSGTENITDKGLSALCKSCPDLSKIKLRYCGWLSQKGIAELSKHCHHLQKITFGRREIDDATLLTLSQNNPGLKTLDGYSCTNTGLEHLAQNCPQLETLRISNVQDQFTGLKAIAQKCLNLKNIYMETKLLDSQLISILQEFHNIETMTLSVKDDPSNQKIKDQDWADLIKNCPNLNSLMLYGYEGMTDGELQALARNNRSLKQFRLHSKYYNNNITEQGVLEMIAMCPSLQKMQLECCKKLPHDIKQSVAQIRPQLKFITTLS